MKTRAVFLDRDGTINRDVGFPDSWSRIQVYPSSYAAVKRLNRAGFLTVVVTNQSGIGRGLIAEADLLDIHERLAAAFEKRGARLDRIDYCPHYPGSASAEFNKDCLCRKPKPGMGEWAAAELNIDLEESYMVGDKVEDIEFGLNIGARPVLVLTGYGLTSVETLRQRGLTPAFIARDLEDAVNWILLDEQARRGVHPEEPER